MKKGSSQITFSPRTVCRLKAVAEIEKVSVTELANKIIDSHLEEQWEHYKRVADVVNNSALPLEEK